MNNFKRIFALMLVLCMALCLCACGGGNETEGTSNSSTQSTAASSSTQSTAASSSSEAVSDGKVEYKVTVLDPDGNPVVGAWVQICLEDLCYNPVGTDEDGVAIFRLEEMEGYKTKLAAPLDGYVDGDYIYFAEGSYEVTITLEAVAE